jgi:hypothetical protein
MVINGIEFSSLDKAYQYFGITRQGVNQFKQKDQYSSHEEALKAYLIYRIERQVTKKQQEDAKRKTLVFKGKCYSTFKAIAKEYGINYPVFNTRVIRAGLQKDNPKKLKLLEKIMDDMANVGSKNYYVELAEQNGIVNHVHKLKYYAKNMGIEEAIERTKRLNWTITDRVVNTPKLYKRFQQTNSFLMIKLPTTTLGEKYAIW